MLNTENKPKFELGRIYVTAGINSLLNEDLYFVRFLQQSLDKYMQCDWGDTCEEDKASNDEALKSGGRILAVYIYEKTNTTIWIITEWDRSVTTILFPDKY